MRKKGGNKPAADGFGVTGTRKPLPGAYGAEHSVIGVDGNGKTSGYTTFRPNDRNPATGLSVEKPVHFFGGAHNGVGTPHTHLPGNVVRPAQPHEVPNRLQLPPNPYRMWKDGK